MRVVLRVITILSLLVPWLVPASALAGPKTKVPECSCSIKTPKNWYVAEYAQMEDGTELLVTASPNPNPSGSDIPSVNFMRVTLGPDESATPEEFLSAIAEEFKESGTVTGPMKSKLGKEDGARIDVSISGGQETIRQRYYVTVRGKDVYLVLLTWVFSDDLPDLEKSAGSVRF